MFARKALAALAALALAAPALSAAVAVGPRDVRSGLLFVVAVSDKADFSDKPLGQYHPGQADYSIAQLWAANQPPMDQDYTYLDGPDFDSLSLVWNRTPEKSLYFGDENAPLTVNDTSTADASRLVGGLSVSEADDVLYIKDDTFQFTACFPPEDTAAWPKYYVSYKNKDTPVAADNCTPITFRVERKPHARDVASWT